MNAPLGVASKDTMSPRLNRSLQIVLDATIMSLAYWLAFMFRFEFHLSPSWFRTLLLTWPYVVIMASGAIAGGVGGAGMARRLGPPALRRLIVAIGFGTALTLMLR